jgi:hypothetical protein
MNRNWMSIVLLATVSGSVRAEPFFFSTGNPDGKMAAASRPSGTALEIEAADDFDLPLQTTIDIASFTGLVPSGTTASNLSQIVIEIYRVFPLDSTNPPSGTVPTRVNSPSDVAFASRDLAGHELTVTFEELNAGFATNNSVLNGIHPVPNQTTGGEGPVFGEEGAFVVTFATPLVLPAGHYFFVPQIQLSSGNFYWLSAPKPIVSPGTPLAVDLQAWIRNAGLAPNWLRIGTDIVGGAPAPTYNFTFSISGEDDRIFADGFGG